MSRLADLRTVTAGIVAVGMLSLLLPPAYAQVAQPFKSNQRVNQSVVDDLQRILDRQSTQGQTPRNNPILRDIQNAILSSGLTPNVGSPGGPTSMAGPLIAITNNGPGTLLLEFATGVRETVNPNNSLKPIDLGQVSPVNIFALNGRANVEFLNVSNNNAPAKVWDGDQNGFSMLSTNGSVQNHTFMQNKNSGYYRLESASSGNPGNPNPSGNVNYVVEVTTGTQLQSPNLSKLGDGPGTDSLVTMTVVGSRGTAAFGPFRTVNNQKRRNNNIYESGTTDGIQFQGPDVGQIQEIRVQRDNTNSSLADWQIAFIQVSKTDARGAKTSASSNRSVWLLDTNPITFRLH